MLKDFKAFIARGNVLDLAIAVIMAAAFGKIITTLNEKMLMPVIGYMTGGIDFTKKFIDLSGKYSGVSDPKSIDEALKGGAPLIMYGQFITDIISFLIVALIMFLLARWFIKYFNSLAAAAPPTPSETLLTEIRDLLKARQA
ncbi:MAG TPA: large conductance mechanosensitive channel protein MscL [Pyrinomonadaceae bacterium]|jgi:large conductance mechanosensitive channel|nr:large conductance mechanosensitive channel protein MscL [Pyrinomonadaceae bacterium]